MWYCLAVREGAGGSMEAGPLACTRGRRLAERAKALGGAQSYQDENCKGRKGGQNRRKAVQSYQGENCKGRKGGQK